MTLALARKGLDHESVWIDYGDRSEVERVSGQGLVPVIEDGGTVVFDSTRILEYLRSSSTPAIETPTTTSYSTASSTTIRS